ncbi:MAG: TadE/TadG family type IV pilus assembly protein [Rhodomicrobium sp.]
MSNFLHSRRGSVLLEAAIAMPVLVLMLLSMAEFGEAFTIKRRNAQVASTAADLVAQVSCVTTASLQDITNIGAIILRPYSYSATIAGLTITSVIQNASNATVQWSCATTSTSLTLSCNSYSSSEPLFSLPPNLVSQNQTVIVAQTSYTFTPQVGSFLTSGVTFKAQAFNYPRLSASVALNPSTPCSS